MDKAISNDFVNKIWKTINIHVKNDLHQGLLFRKKNKDDLIKFRISTIDLNYFWSKTHSILDEVKRIFYRLTQKPNESYVPLWDLIDDRPLKEKLDNNSIQFAKETAYGVLKAILYYTAEDCSFPVEYDAENGVFTKKSDTFNLIAELDSSFAEWEKNTSTSFGKI